MKLFPISWIIWFVASLGPLTVLIHPDMMFAIHLVWMSLFLALVPITLWIKVPFDLIYKLGLLGWRERIGLICSGLCHGVIFVSVFFVPKIQEENVANAFLPALIFLFSMILVTAYFSTETLQRFERLFNRTPSPKIYSYLSFLILPLGMFYLRNRFDKIATVDTFT